MQYIFKESCRICEKLGFERCGKKKMKFFCGKVCFQNFFFLNRNKPKFKIL